jgi:hypothetical protein
MKEIKSKLLKEAADLVECKQLSNLYSLCENQKTVSTSKLDEELYKVELNLKLTGSSVAQLTRALDDVDANLEMEKRLHSEAAAIEIEAMKKMQSGATHIAYDKLDLSKALRMAANYIGGVNAG